MYFFKKIIHSIILFFVFSNKYSFLKYILYSKAQLSQDIFALSELNYKEKGFFVEFGACDGKYISNTFMLEKKLKWNGILAEPAKEWHFNLAKNRAVNIETSCVWENSNDKLIFSEAIDPALSYLSSPNTNLKNNKSKKNYEVSTISLVDLLKKYESPKIIDFMTIDTEGSEYKILKNFDFKTYKIKVLCIEHNYGQDRDMIYNLLKKNNYKRVYTFLSRFDDWYILEE